MSRIAEIKFPKQYKALFEKKYRHIVYKGGRGGGKSESVARSLIIRSMQDKELILCTRETQNSIDESVHRLIAGLIEHYGFSKNFNITRDRITCLDTGSEFIFKGLRKESIDSLKSIPNISIVWVEEASSVSLESINKLIPTIRKEGSQLIWTYNPETANDPVETEITNKADENTYVCHINSHDIEAWLPETFIEEREKMKRNDPMMYEHVYLGQPLTAKMGAIYAELIAIARDDKRIGDYPYNQSYPVYAALDLGWGDSMSIVFAQKIGDKIRIIDHYENSEKTTGHYIGIMKDKDYRYERIFLPHDARSHDRRSGNTDEEIFANMGFNQTEVLPIESVDTGIDRARTAFNRVEFNESSTERLLECLRNYHREWDDKNQLLKKDPKHDWSSHSADSFRYMIGGLEKSATRIKTYIPSWVD